MILHEVDYARADAKIIMLKARCDRLRRRVADPRVAETAMVEISRVENRIEELTNHMQCYRKIVRERSAQQEQAPLIASIALIDIPDRLIERRLKLGWTHAKLATATGLTRQSVSRYEHTRYAGVALKRLIYIDHVMRIEEIRRLKVTSEIESFRS